MNNPRSMDTRGHFSHKPQGPWPLYSKISHSSKRARPSKFTSLHTRRWRWRCKGLKRLSWMKSLYGFLHGKLWIMVHGLLEFASYPPPRGRPNANSCIPFKVNNWYGLWMRVKGPYNHMVTVLGSCVKWPSFTSVTTPMLGSFTFAFFGNIKKFHGFC